MLRHNISSVTLSFSGSRCGGGLITPEHVVLQSGPGSRSPTANLNEIVRRQIEQTLHETAWNIAQSARCLGLTRTQLCGRIKQYQLERPEKRDE
jgi:transcriptional regulator with GAF, ATPase, and Fis domain